MEYLDIYDENACKTGKTIIRGTPVRQGEYSMAVHLYIYNAKGEFLIQKRSKNKKSLPGIWSVTCGAVVAGENSLQAGIREAEEELGLRLAPEQLQMVSRIKRRRSFIDIYFVEEDFSIDRCVLQGRKWRMCVSAAAGNCWRLSVPPNGSTAVIRRRWSGQ